MTTTEYVAPTKEQRAVAHALWADAAYKRLEATARPHPSNRLAKIVSVDIEDYARTNGISRTGVDAETRAFADVLLPDIARRGWARIIPAAALNAVLERDNRFTLTHTGPEYGNRYANQGRRVKFWMLTHKVEAFRVAAEAEAAAKAEEARLYAEKRQAEIAAARRLADVTEEVSDALRYYYGTEDTGAFDRNEIIVVRYGEGGEKRVLATFDYGDSPYLSRDKAMQFANGIREALFTDAVNAEIKRRLEVE